MGRHRKPSKLSDTEVRRFLLDARRLLDSNNQASVRTDSPQYRAIVDLNEAIVEAAKIITGSDRPWPVFCSSGPC